MKKLAIFALTALCAVSFATAAFAQAEASDAGVFFDLAGTTTTADIGPFVQTPMYVLGFQLGGIAGWESGVTFSDTTWLVLSATLNPGDAINVGGVGNFIVGLGGCFDEGAVHTLVTYNIGNFSGLPLTDTVVCMGAADPSSFGGAPGYNTCQDELIPFGAAENGGNDYPNFCGVINAQLTPPVAVHETSWGAVKADF